MGPNETSASATIFLPVASTERELRAFGQKHVESLLAVLWFRKHVAKRDVRQQITVVVDVEPVNGVGMERVGIWICVEDDHGSRRVGGRLKRIEIAQVESLVAERWTEAESSKMIRHDFLPFVIHDREDIELAGLGPAGVNAILHPADCWPRNVYFRNGSKAVQRQVRVAVIECRISNTSASDPHPHGPGGGFGPTPGGRNDGGGGGST